LSDFTAWFSSEDEPLGLSFVILMPYFFWKVDMISP
jgi:hypothetical protein